MRLLQRTSRHFRFLKYIGTIQGCNLLPSSACVKGQGCAAGEGLRDSRHVLQGQGSVLPMPPEIFAEGGFQNKGNVVFPLDKLRCFHTAAKNA
jgi:hypothetical protein